MDAQLERIFRGGGISGDSFKASRQQQFREFAVGTNALRGWALVCLAIAHEGVLRKRPPLSVVITTVRHKCNAANFQAAVFLKCWQEAFGNCAYVYDKFRMRSQSM